MKYVMFEKKSDLLSHRVPIIFPATMVHADVAAAIAPLLPNYSVVSAGEISIVPARNVLHCHGSSETLSLSHHPDDEQTIALNDYGGAFT